MYECIKNFDCIKEWVISNLLWTILFGIIVFIFFKFLPLFTQAIKITKIILKNNRDTRDNGLGKYSADRFLNIWYSSEKSPLRYEYGVFYPLKFGLNSRHLMNVIDNELESLKLVKIFDSEKGYKAVKPIRNWRNDFVAKLTKFYLTKFIGDNIQYYKNLEEQSKK